MKFFRWFQKHIKDEFVKYSRNEGYRARSACKLLQILENFPMLKKSLKIDGVRIVDLGAAPGSWCQVLTNFVPPSAKIVAIDLLPIKPIEQVQTIVHDFSSNSAHDLISKAFKSNSDRLNIQLVVSDLCANISGNSCIDNNNNLQLWHLALKFVNSFVCLNGHFIMKYFESKEAANFRKTLEKYFDRVLVFKPAASRSESSEKYFICLNKNKNI